MLYHSRKAMKEEALRNAEITLEATVQHIDNIVLSVEQATGNIYLSLLPYLDQPEMVVTYCRRLVEANPQIVGCAIATEENFYKDHPYFMAYVHRGVEDGKISSDNIIEEVCYDGEYLKQAWYRDPMTSLKPGWQEPLIGDEADEIPIITFCLPILDANRVPIGVMGVGVSLSHLSEVILAAKPSLNSYSVLLNSDGTYIVHPNSKKLMNQRITDYLEEGSDARKAAEAMISGKEGYMPFYLDSTHYYVFYRPYERNTVEGRTMEKLSWSAGIIYPENDIFGEYNKLLLYVLVIAFVSLLLLLFLCRTIIHRQLKPLLMLTEKAQNIAKGNYNETIPDTMHQDEIGRLQDNFKQMQQSLAVHMNELEQLTTSLEENKIMLQAAYNQAAKADRMKTAFLHNMTNQMIGPSASIEKDVDTLIEIVSDPKNNADINKLAEDIQIEGKIITDLLKNLINTSDEDKMQASDGEPTRKEATDD